MRSAFETWTFTTSIIMLAWAVGCNGSEDGETAGSATDGTTETGGSEGGTGATSATGATDGGTSTSTTDTASGSDATGTATTGASTPGSTGETTMGATEGGTGGETDYVPCSRDNPCEDGVICWGDGGMPSASVCGAPCTRPGDCPEPSSGTATPICVEDTLDPQSHYCILSCDGKVCPDDMECLQLGNSSYCFWPPP